MYIYRENSTLMRVYGIGTEKGKKTQLTGKTDQHLMDFYQTLISYL